MLAEYELEAPSDSIASLLFSPFSDDLIATSWDKSVTVYSNDKIKAKFFHAGPALDAAFASQSHAVSAGIDKCVRYWNIENSADSTVLARHEDAVKSVVVEQEYKSIISGSWDKTFKILDPRASIPEVGSHTVPHKIYSMDSACGKLVIATAERLFLIYDLRNTKEELQRRESSLKYMTRLVKCMPNGLGIGALIVGYATCSIEGRVAVEFFEEADQEKKYAFKCHREKLNGVDTVYPVNALAFHPIHGTFVSGGSDGFVNLWDGFNKKRLKQYPRYPTGISALSFNSSGTKLAVASSYSFEEGEKDAAVGIHIRNLAENETKPKIVTAEN